MPVLLVGYLLAANIPRGARLYGIVVVVVVFSVLVQGSLVPIVARANRKASNRVHDRSARAAGDHIEAAGTMVKAGP